MLVYAPDSNRNRGDTEEVHPVIDPLWEYIFSQNTNFLATEQLKNSNVNIVSVPDADDHTVDFEPFYFELFPSGVLDNYRITERQKTPGYDMAIEDYEPEKDIGRPRVLRKWAPITRADYLLESLSQGLFHYTVFENKSKKGGKEVHDPLILFAHLHNI